MDNQKIKNVMFVETGLGFGGSAVSLYEIVSNLKNCSPCLLFYTSRHSEFISKYKGMDCTFLNIKFSYVSKNRFRRRLEFIPFRFVRFSLFKVYILLSYFYDYMLKKKIVRLLRRKNVSVLYANNTIESLLISCAREANIPCIVHLRGHVNTNASKENIEYIKALIAPTQKIWNYAVEALNVPASKVLVIHNSVNTEIFSDNSERVAVRRKYNIDKNTTIIAMYARIIRMKGQMILAESIVKLLHEKRNVVCMFVGDISDFGEDYIYELKEYIERSGYSDYFVFTGYQDNMPAYYKAADIVIHPSIEDEAFGRIIIEAWAARRPVIASDIPASCELIKDNELGYLYSKSSANQLYEKIKFVLDNEVDVKRVTSNASKHVKNFKTLSVVEKIEDVICH